MGPSVTMKSARAALVDQVRERELPSWRPKVRSKLLVIQPQCSDVGIGGVGTLRQNQDEVIRVGVGSETFEQTLHRRWADAPVALNERCVDLRDLYRCGDSVLRCSGVGGSQLGEVLKTLSGKHSGGKVAEYGFEHGLLRAAPIGEWPRCIRAPIGRHLAPHWSRG